MLIQCDSCKAKYMVSPKSIGASGRPVKCVKCGHTWFVRPTSEEINTANKIEESSLKFQNYRGRASLPATIEDTPLFLQILPMVLLLCILAIGIIYYKDFFEKIPGAETLYELSGAFPTRGVTLEDMNITKKDSEKGYTILFQGNIVNNSLEERTLPNLRIRILSNKGDELLNQTLKSNKFILKPGEKFPIKNEIKGIYSWAEFLIFDIGNSLALFTR